MEASALVSPRRARRLALLALAVVAVLALGERGLRGVVARSYLRTGAAEWIWLSGTSRESAPAAFYAARDFELEAPPATARLLALGDEEYVLYLNGQRIGSNSYTPDAPLDVYRIEGLLQPGWNRLVAELRSGRGAGGFLARLEDAAGEPLVWTDERWQVFERHHPGLIRGWLPLAGGAPAFSWALPPVGRWNVPEPGPERPLYRDLLATGGPGRPPVALSPVAARALGTRVRSRPGPGNGELPGGRLEPQALFDFGREVEGYLALEHLPSDTPGVALLFAGAEPPDPRQSQPQDAIVCMPGRRVWLDARPRRFRYALVLGMERLSGARLHPVRPAAARPLQPAAGPLPGVFGIAPPPLRTPIEDEVWRSLRRVP